MSVQILSPTTFVRNCPIFASNGDVLVNFQRSYSEVHSIDVNAKSVCCVLTLNDLVDQSNNNYNYYYNEPDALVVYSKKKKC